MLAHFALAVERGGIEQDVGLDEHLGDAGEALAARVADPVQRIHVRELGDNAADVLGDVGVVHLRITEKPPANQLVEHLPQRVLSCDRHGCPFRPRPSVHA